MHKKSKKITGEPAQSASCAQAIQNTTLAYALTEPDFPYDEDNDDGAAEIGSVEETARYIADMIASLAMIAREAKFDLLGYLLDMARVEAEIQARQSETPFEDD